MKEYIVKIGKELVHVNKELYVTYYKMSRRERYLDEVDKKKTLSYEQLIEEDFPVEEKLIEPVKLTDDIAIDKILRSKLKIAIKKLSREEWFIIEEIFIKETHIRKLSKKILIPQSTIKYKRDKILKKLKKLIESN